MKIHIKDLNELYAAITDIQNVGKTLVLATGTYTLSEKIDTVNAGRLELLKNMTLQGQKNHPKKVIIDASQLPDSSFAPVSGFTTRTGAIRMGYGTNNLEWLTVKGSSTPSSLSVIDTDLINGQNSTVRIANCIISEGRIGINVRNVVAASNNRKLIASIEHNELLNNNVSAPGTQQGQGIVIQHANGVSDAHIQASLQKNFIHDNTIGIRIFNNSNSTISDTSRNIIEVTSNNDIIENNKLGMYFSGGSINGGNKKIDGNKIVFDAYDTIIRNNKGILPDITTLPCGIFLSGGTRSVAGAATNNNDILMNLLDCPVSGNQNKDIIAFGAFTYTAFPPGKSPVLPLPPGANHTVVIHLKGASIKASCDVTDSYAVEPVRTNKVILI